MMVCALLFLHVSCTVHVLCGCDCVFEAEKQLEIQLFKLYHNEREIEDLSNERNHKQQSLDKETKKVQKVEDELREKKKEQGKLIRDITKIEQQIKESVS